MVYRLNGLNEARSSSLEREDQCLLSAQRLSTIDANPNLYIYRENGLSTVIVLYVDDLIITGGNVGHITQNKASLQSEFEMTDMGLLQFFPWFGNLARSKWDIHFPEAVCTGVTSGF